MIDKILENVSALFIVVEHAPACTGRRQQHRLAGLRMFSCDPDGFLHAFREYNRAEAVFFRTFGNLLPGLAHENQQLDLTVLAKEMGYKSISKKLRVTVEALVQQQRIKQITIGSKIKYTV